MMFVLVEKKKITVKTRGPYLTLTENVFWELHISFVTAFKTDQVERLGIKK